MKQLNKEQAIKISESKVCKNWTDEQIVRFQLFQNRLCMDFETFHKAISKVLKRDVYTHEFAFIKELKIEYLGGKKTPSFDEIINLIPKEKRLLIKP